MDIPFSTTWKDKDEQSKLNDVYTRVKRNRIERIEFLRPNAEALTRTKKIKIQVDRYSINDVYSETRLLHSVNSQVQFNASVQAVFMTIHKFSVPESKPATKVTINRSH